jgi:hypothetical protein
MKTKLKKDWLGREKSIEEMHSDATQWKSEINFVKDEIRFLEHLLSSNYIELLHVGLYKKIEYFVNELSIQKQNGKTLLKLIEEHELILSDLILKNCATDNKKFLKKHSSLHNEFEKYSYYFKKNKKQIFKIIESIMRDKNKKMLIN